MDGSCIRTGQSAESLPKLPAVVVRVQAGMEIRWETSSFTPKSEVLFQGSRSASPPLLQGYWWCQQHFLLFGFSVILLIQFETSQTLKKFIPPTNGKGQSHLYDRYCVSIINATEYLSALAGDVKRKAGKS